MIKRILLFILIPTLLFAQIGDWKGKTVNQLSGMVSGTTDIGSKSYWETKAYNQIHDIINRIDKIQYVTDYTTITTAFAGMSDSSGGELFVPKGTYSMTQNGDTDGMLEFVNNMVLRGEGFGSIIDFTKDATDGNVILDINGDTNVVIMNLKIVGDMTDAYASEYDHAINIRNSYNVIIINCIIDSTGGDAIYIRDSDNIIIANCTFNMRDNGGGSGHSGTFDYGRNGVSVTDGSNIIISNNIGYGGFCGVDLEPNTQEQIEGVNIIGNLFYDFKYGILISGGNADYVKNINITGNTVRDVYDVGIYILGDTITDSMDVYEVNITSNMVDSTTFGWGIGCVSAYDVVVDGNNVHDCEKVNIYVGDSSYSVIVSNNKSYYSQQDGIQVSDADNILLTGNMVYSNVDDGITISASRNISAMSNICYNNANDGIDVIGASNLIGIMNNGCYDTDGSQNYGINLNGGDSIVVSGNFMWGNETSQSLVDSDIRAYWWGTNVGSYTKGWGEFINTTDSVFSWMGDSTRADIWLGSNDNASGGIIKIWGEGSAYSQTNSNQLWISGAPGAAYEIKQGTSGTGTKRHLYVESPGAAYDIVIEDSANAAMVRVTGDYIFSLDHAAFDIGVAQTFVDSDATPDVTGYTYWNTNTTTYTITDFDGTITDGHIIVVTSKGAITFDVTSSGIVGGTTDIITATGDVTMFKYDGTDWYVVSRIDQSDDLN